MAAFIVIGLLVGIVIYLGCMGGFRLMKTDQIKTNQDLLRLADERLVIQLLRKAIEPCNDNRCEDCPFLIDVAHDLLTVEKTCPCCSQNFNPWYHSTINKKSTIIQNFLYRLRFKKEGD